MPRRMTAAAAALVTAGLLAAGCGTAVGPTESGVEPLRARTVQLEAALAALQDRVVYLEADRAMRVELLDARLAGIEAWLGELEAFAEGAPAELEAILDQLLAFGMVEGLDEGFGEGFGEPPG